MKVLVTGSSGMVGKEVIAELKEKKHQSVEFDKENGGDILDDKKLNEKMNGVDTIIHLAGIIDEKNPKLWEVNVTGTNKVLNAAIKSKVKKIIFASSTAVYGNTKNALNENTRINPKNNYEKSKAEGEKIILGAKNKITVCVIRSAMVFGANEYWKKMIKMLEKKYPLPCSGENHYQIIYSKEIARALITVMEKGKNGEIYLAAGEEKPTLNEFCEMIQEEMGLEKRVKHIPSWLGILLGKIFGIKLLTSENIRHISKERNYDTTKIQKLGWKQNTSLKEAIKIVIQKLN